MPWGRVIRRTRQGSGHPGGVARCSAERDGGPWGRPGERDLGCAGVGQRLASHLVAVQALDGGTAVGGATCSIGSPFTPPLTCDVTGLTNGTAYMFTVVATNAVGDSDPSTALVAGDAGGGAGRAAQCHGGPRRHRGERLWDAPTSDEWSPVTSYLVQALDGGSPVGGATCTINSPFTPPLTCDVTGLSNGTAYTFTVTATNAIGTSDPSDPSDLATPAGLPGAPQNVTAVRGGRPGKRDLGCAGVGQRLASHLVRRAGVGRWHCGGGATCSIGSPFTPPLTCDVTGLTNGTAYMFTVVATNAVGDSDPSIASAPVTPAGVPGAPHNVTAVRGDTEASVVWDAPTSENGLPVTSYLVQALDGGSPVGGATCTISSPFTPPLTCMSRGLTNGTAYMFTVVATNAVGDSDPSTASAAVTPAGLPGAPQNVTAVRGDTQASVAWSAPISTGGSPILSYLVQAAVGGTPVVGATCMIGSPLMTCDVTGLINGTAYTFTVTAANDVGTSDPSTASAAVTPAGVPGAPQNVTAVRGDTRASVMWDAPTSDNGSPITSYAVQALDGGSPVGGATCTINSPFTPPLTCDVTGLTNGTAYMFTVTATNDVETSDPSTASAAVTPAGLPGAPQNVTAVRGDTGERHLGCADLGQRLADHLVHGAGVNAGTIRWVGRARSVRRSPRR